MKSLMTLAVFCFIFCFHTAIGQQYYGLYKSEVVMLPWINMPTPTNYLLVSTSGKTHDLILNPVLYKDKSPEFMIKSASITGSDNYGTFSGKWERLMGKPIIDTSRLYIPASKIRNIPAYHYSPLYRATATIFNFAVAAKYPYLNTSK